MLLDRSSSTAVGGEGRGLQEEYLEWRTVRRGGCIQRVELTADLPERWVDLAAHAPERLLSLVAELADKPKVPALEIYGSLDISSSSPEQLAAAFSTSMLSPVGLSPYNDGTRAICCMVQPTNTAAALVKLVSAATVLRPVEVEGGIRSPTAAELAGILNDAAQMGRASDPVVVERVARLAFEGRRFAFEEPVGVRIVGVERHRLRTPDGEGVPAEWFGLSDPIGGDVTDGFITRMVVEVPAEAGFTVSDLVDVATEEPIRFGGQIAELVQVAVTFHVSPPIVDAARDVQRFSPCLTEPDPCGCAELIAQLETMTT